MNGADAIISCLEKEQIDTIFGYPGLAISPFFNSILKTNIKTILVRTEQNAAHAASGMARITGKPGVCVVTSGPGATNVITGIATAFADSIPLICITGQVESSLIGSDVFQEADITGAVESFVKYSYIIKNEEDIPKVLKEAFYIASTGRKGPVLIDIPFDIQNNTIKKFIYPNSVNLRTYKPTFQGNIAQIKKVAKAISKAKKPIICAGGGVLLSCGKECLTEFATKNKIPVVSTMMGLGVMPTENPLYFGMVGNNGNPYANKAMNESDLLIMVGARVADRAISQPDLVMENKVLVHIDVDPAEIGKNATATIPLVGDSKDIFETLNKQDINGDYSLWIESLNEMKKNLSFENDFPYDYVNPFEFIKKMSYKMKDNAIYVADVGQNQIWSCMNHIVKNGRFLTSGGMGTMGYSIPAAIGAKLGAPNRQVLAVCGDGAFQMSFMELATIRQYHIPIKIIVFTNTTLGMVREYQKTVYKRSFSMVDLEGSPDLSKIAEAYDMAFLRISSMDNLNANLDTFLTNENAYLIECIVDPEVNSK